MARYSHSKLSTFEQCPLKFKYRYIDKIIPEIEKSIESHLGTAVHEVLEWIYTEVKDNQKVPTLDNVIVCYTEAWQKGYSEKLVIVKKEITAKDYFNKGIQFLIDYYSKHEPFNDGTIEIEKEISIELNGHKITGFIDRLVHNIETGEYEIHDYKTANSLPSKEKIEEDRQLALYSIAIKEKFGKDKSVCLVWHYLAHNQKICSKRTNEQLEQLKKETIELIKKIEATTEFPANKSMLCSWCEYKQTCEAWQNKDLKKYPTISKYIKD
jgi:putative RecB family exonuclease